MREFGEYSVSLGKANENSILRYDAQSSLVEIHRIEDIPPNMPKGIMDLCRHWFGYTSQDPVLPRRMFDPMAFAAYLPGVLLLDFEGLDATGDAVYRYRIAGDDEVRNRGFNPTGKTLREGVFFISYERALAGYEKVRSMACPHLGRASFKSDRGTIVREMSIMLPMRRSDNGVDQILVYSHADKNGLPQRGTETLISKPPDTAL